MGLLIAGCLVGAGFVFGGPVVGMLVIIAILIAANA